jgi:hypothetical protein
MTDEIPPSTPRTTVPAANSEELRKQTALLKAILEELQRITLKLDQ